VVVFGSSASLGVVGWALFGLGLATVAPTVLGAAPRTDDAPPAAAIAMVMTVGYLGSFTGPPVIGALAQATSLSTALLLLVAIAAALACSPGPPSDLRAEGLRAEGLRAEGLRAEVSPSRWRRWR
jgi:MFS family permease